MMNKMIKKISAVAIAVAMSLSTGVAAGGNIKSIF